MCRYFSKYFLQNCTNTKNRLQHPGKDQKISRYKISQINHIHFPQVKVLASNIFLTLEEG